MGFLPSARHLGEVVTAQRTQFDARVELEGRTLPRRDDDPRRAAGFEQLLQHTPTFGVNQFPVVDEKGALHRAQLVQHTALTILQRPPDEWGDSGKGQTAPAGQKLPAQAFEQRRLAHSRVALQPSPLAGGEAAEEGLFFGTAQQGALQTGSSLRRTQPQCDVKTSGFFLDPARQRTFARLQQRVQAAQVFGFGLGREVEGEARLGPLRRSFEATLRSLRFGEFEERALHPCSEVLTLGIDPFLQLDAPIVQSYTVQKWSAIKAMRRLEIAFGKTGLQVGGVGGDGGPGSSIVGLQAIWHRFSEPCQSDRQTVQRVAGRRPKQFGQVPPFLRTLQSEVSEKKQRFDPVERDPV